MAYCVRLSEIDLSKQKIVSGPWVGDCEDCTLVSSSSSSSSSVSTSSSSSSNSSSSSSSSSSVCPYLDCGPNGLAYSDCGLFDPNCEFDCELCECVCSSSSSSSSENPPGFFVCVKDRGASSSSSQSSSSSEEYSSSSSYEGNRLIQSIPQDSHCINFSQYNPSLHELLLGPFLEEECYKCDSSSSSSSSDPQDPSSSSSPEDPPPPTTTESPPPPTTTESPPPTTTVEPPLPCVECPPEPGSGGGGDRVSALEDLPCCPQGPDGGGDIHMFWGGYGSTNAGMVDNLVFFDDNIILGSLSEGESSKFDHYAVEWFEVHADGSYAAILSERRIVCLFPQTNIASGLVTIGSPIGATVTTSCSNLKTPDDCSECVVDEPWCRLKTTINYQNLIDMQSFGGLKWEAMRYIAQNADSIGPTGFTGPIGNNATFFSGFRTSNPSPSLDDIVRSSQGRVERVSNREGFRETIQKLTELSARIASWDNVDLEETINQRRTALLATARTPASGEPKCCYAIDLDYLGGTPCCGCKEIDPTLAQCDTPTDDCDPCKGVCTEIATGNSTCDKITDCCGPGNERCSSTCSGIVPTHTWSSCSNANCSSCSTTWPSAYFRQERIPASGSSQPIPEGCSCGSQCQRETQIAVGKSFSAFGFTTSQLQWKPCYPALLNSSGKQWNIVAKTQTYSHYQDIFGSPSLDSICERKWYRCANTKVDVKVFVCEGDSLVDVTSDVLSDAPRTITYYDPYEGDKVFTTSGPHYNYEFCFKRSAGGAGNEAGPFDKPFYENGGCSDCTMGDYMPFPE